MSNFNSELGLELGDSAGKIILDTRPEHQIAPGVIHFAVLATMAEVSAAQVIDAPVVPASVHLNLLAPASPGHLEAQGRLLRRGKRLAVAEGEVLQDQTMVAKATVTFAILRS